MLQREGTLISKNGVGTYVNERPSFILNPLNKLRSLGEMIKSVGYKENKTDVKIYTKEPEQEWSEKLGTRDPVVILERIDPAMTRRSPSTIIFFPRKLPQITSRMTSPVQSSTSAREMGIDISHQP